MPAGQLGNLRGSGSKVQALLWRVDIAPLLRDAPETRGVARRRNRNRAFAATKKEILCREAAILGRTPLEVMQQAAVG